MFTPFGAAASRSTSRRSRRSGASPSSGARRTHRAAGTARLVAIALMLGVLPVRAGQANPTPSTQSSAPPVDALIERALARAPSLAAQKTRVEAARAVLQAAGAVPNPMVEVMYQDFNFPRYTIGSDPMSMAGASIEQGLRSRGRRAAERHIAQADIEQRRAAERTTATDIATEVRLEYARLYALDREADTIGDARDLVRMLEATSSAHYAAGHGDQASILRAQLERTRLDERAADLAGERVAIQAALNRLTNDPPDAPIGRVATLPEPPATAAVGRAAAEQAAKTAPDIAMREAGLDVARRQVDAARAELAPSWSVGAGYYWQGGFDRTVKFTVGLELPVWNARRQKPLLAAAESEQRAAELDLANARAEVAAQATALAAAVHTASQQIDLYRTAILPQNSAALDAARASYLADRGDFVSVLDEFRRWIDVRTELARREAERFSARARLDALLNPRAQ